MKPAAAVVELDVAELHELLQRAKTDPLRDEDYQKLKNVVDTLALLTQLLEDRNVTIQKLRQMLCRASSEKTRTVLGANGELCGSVASEPAATAQDASQVGDPGYGEGPNSENKGAPDSKAKGHGRNGACQYTGGTKIRIGHESLRAGDGCPKCLKGKVYASVPPGYLVRLVGQAPVGATVWELEKLRCNLCGEVFTAQQPEGVGSEKYDATSAAMIAILKYGSGFPFYRLQGLQQSLGIPLPASTQWAIVAEEATTIQPAFGELVRQAAQGEVVYNDDTTARILALMKERAAAAAAGNEWERTGVFTSGIVSTRDGRHIALFFTGRKHAGENLADVLRKRAAELGPPIQMCDALSRNLPQELQVILANCNAHARRHFVQVAPSFPGECRYVLETLRDVYHNDEVARAQALTPDQRLAFHQAHSGPLMDQLHQWLQDQIEQRKVEPNSTLGGAISYMKNHWKRLTLFLHVAGAPLDSNVVERALKKAILHRKSALFFKTTRGAGVGDLFMSLVHTCELAGANPLDYLTELQKHAGKLAENPEAWMPWNYRETIAILTASPPAPT